MASDLLTATMDLRRRAVDGPVARADVAADIRWFPRGRSLRSTCTRSGCGGAASVSIAIDGHRRRARGIDRSSGIPLIHVGVVADDRCSPARGRRSGSRRHAASGSAASPCRCLTDALHGRGDRTLRPASCDGSTIGRGTGASALHGETGAGEAYIDGGWSTPDLSALLELAALNREALAL